ncbi:hypothetical protein ILYODFUR_019586 [Ilyodon furcidens]|uniref:Uncharacterized protein n=1 Tax=Ilyodon furcidens TaxID=33524 RepID=A0ABV0V6P0_9TELE
MRGYNRASVSMPRFARGFTNSHYVFKNQKVEVQHCMGNPLHEQTHDAVAAAFCTYRQQSKQAPQLCMCSTVLGSTCRLLSDGLVPKLLPLLCLTSPLLSFGICAPNYTHSKHFGILLRGTKSILVQNP